MVSVESEFPSKKIHVEFCYAKYYGKSLLFNLAAILFCWAEGSRGIDDGSFCIIWETMRDYCSDTILTCITL